MSNTFLYGTNLYLTINWTHRIVFVLFVHLTFALNINMRLYNVTVIIVHSQ